MACNLVDGGVRSQILGTSLRRQFAYKLEEWGVISVLDGVNIIAAVFSLFVKKHEFMIVSDYIISSVEVR
jgi:hypothetical protein